MDENQKDNGQFRMRMDDSIDDNVIPAQVDELRIEKLSTRVTIISIMIPVLIAVVLAITYLDIKKRVAHTEDTGTSGVENLSKDMESRFSTLSVRQANLEELIKKLNAENDKSMARIQVTLKNLDDSANGLKKAMVSQTELERKTAKLHQEIGNVAQAVEAGNAKMEEMTQALKSQMDQISANAAQDQTRLAQMDKKLIGLNQEKIDKATLDLALSLEILKLKKSYQAQLNDLQERIRQLEKMPAPASSQSVPVPTKPSSGLTPPQTSASASSDGIVEQKIDK
jgi:uncharacterized phage infection (PIP) family protein YhgE